MPRPYAVRLASSGVPGRDRRRRRGTPRTVGTKRLAVPSPRLIEVETTSIAAGGDAVARDVDGRVVFVTGALPGEVVRAEVTIERRDYARALAVEVLSPSSGRVTAPCPEVARGCGGCQWQHVSPEAQRRLKREIVTDALRRIGRIETPFLEPTIELTTEGYRTAVRAAVVEGRAGLRRARSHDVVEVEGCLVAHPLVADLLVNGRFPGATEVDLRCGASTGDRLAAPHPTDAPIVVPPDVRRDHLHEIAGGRSWRISAASFFQSRADGADALAELVTTAAGGLDVGRAVDLYSGVGLFAGVLAERGWSVIAVEGSTAAVSDARHNLRHDDAVVVAADVTTWKASSADLVVADPSRSGLRREGVAVVAATGARRVVLVSCDAAALGRDAGLLITAGYTPTTITPVDLFPHTAHVEVVSVYDRDEG